MHWRDTSQRVLNYKNFQRFLAERSAIVIIMSSVCLSVCLPVTKCIVAKQYILQQKCPNK